ncbi:hypothetical protein BJ138DRAFT_1117203 [Hygrophoropsis aurantiaca]|uniref:Uncharacterized protein n=1 Tax=Hygrophoropsis aurantiaca TaxID=72124 RepID=A0ACB8A111_9AGAM|nr:hypothetical protein BJ138DRAFT_1117203 [Hygrophoropsis aurantiaca]
MPASLRPQTRAPVSKPYEKRSPSIDPASPAISDYQESIVSPLLPCSDPSDKLGFPTYACYKRIEAAYLACLSPRKRDKALISQVMFDKIWDVLHQPDDCTIESPQFRFWVRKMFTLTRQGRQEDEHYFETPAVVLHENRPVAVMEQLYELFCYCHERANHGGRDKTCAVIRQHYSWVPKELTAQFVKACPTCAVKRPGNSESTAILRDHVHALRSGTVDGLKGEPAEFGASQGWINEQENWFPSGGPLDGPAVLYLDEPPSMQCTPCPSGQPIIAGTGTVDAQHTRPQETAMLHGLPYGWSHFPLQIPDPAYRFSTSVMPDFIQRPSAPGPTYLYSVARVPGLFVSSSSGSVDHGDSSANLPSLSCALKDDSLDDDFALSWPDYDGNSLPPVLQHLRISSPVKSNTKYTPQIDPALLALDVTRSDLPRSRSEVHDSDENFEMSRLEAHGPLSKSTSVEISSPTPTKLKRRPVSNLAASPILSPVATGRKTALVQYLTSIAMQTQHQEEEIASSSGESSTSPNFSGLSAFSSTSDEETSPFTITLPSPNDEAKYDGKMVWTNAVPSEAL